MPLQQLKHQARQCGEDGIRPSPVTGVFESDQHLDDDLSQEVLDALEPLKAVPDDQKDWHPGSDQQVPPRPRGIQEQAQSVCLDKARTLCA